MGLKGLCVALFLCNTQYCDFNCLANRSIKLFIPYYRFEKDIEDMLGHAPNIYWKIMWRAVSPLLLIALLIYYIVNYIMGGTVTYQAWVKENVSWILLLSIHRYICHISATIPRARHYKEFTHLF